jgi:hypothetical protein
MHQNEKHKNVPSDHTDVVQRKNCLKKHTGAQECTGKGEDCLWYEIMLIFNTLYLYVHVYVRTYVPWYLVHTYHYTVWYRRGTIGKM